MVMPTEVAVRHQLQVVRPIIERVVIAVVNVLVWAQGTTEHLFHDVTMLIRPFSSRTNFDHVIHSRASLVQALAADRLRLRGPCSFKIDQVLCSDLSGVFRGSMARDASRIAFKSACLIMKQWYRLAAAAWTDTAFVRLKWRHYRMSLS